MWGHAQIMKALGLDAPPYATSEPAEDIGDAALGGGISSIEENHGSLIHEPEFPCLDGCCNEPDCPRCSPFN